MLASWKKSNDQPRQHSKKQRHYFATQVYLVKTMVFPVVMYGCETWTIKKAECRRIDAFELWCWKTLESPLDCKEIQPVHPKGNQSWKDWCWSWNSNVLATWCKELTHLKRPQLWERLKVGGEGDDRGWDNWMASLTQWTWVWVNSRSWWCTGRPGMLQSMGSQRIRHDWVTELNWTEASPTLSHAPLLQSCVLK